MSGREARAPVSVVCRCAFFPCMASMWDFTIKISWRFPGRLEDAATHYTKKKCYIRLQYIQKGHRCMDPLLTSASCQMLEFLCRWCMGMYSMVPAGTS